jgi:hypothetical protein
MERTVDKRVYSCWIVVEPAEGMPGTWVSHCLNFDLVSYGDSPKDAADSVCEAIEDALIDDFENQRDPLQRGSTTPAECWTQLENILRSGRTVKITDVASNAEHIRLARQLNFVVTIEAITPVSVEPMPLSVPTYESHEVYC